MARLAAQHEDADREERFPEENDLRRERRRQRKRAAVDDAGAAALGAEVAEGRSRHKSGARLASGAYLEEGHSSDPRVRRRGGGGSAVEDQWKEEDSWEGSYDSRGRPPAWKFWSNWSKKKRIVIGCLLLVALILAIIIPVAVVLSKKKSSDSGSSSPSNSDGPSNSNLDSISRDSIPVS
jgi:glucan 1,3-beta-glucosidase